jgi:hypothetical protein
MHLRYGTSVLSLTCITGFHPLDFGLYGGSQPFGILLTALLPSKVYRSKDRHLLITLGGLSFFMLIFLQLNLITMDVEKIPVIGKINRTLNILMVNFVLLALVCVILGVVIPFYPQVLDLLVAALLIVSAVIFLNIAYNLYTTKKKYINWLK